MTSNQIYNFSNNTAIVDLSNCDLLLFVGCQTANHATKSLPQAAVNTGAEAALGFTGDIDCTIANKWLPLFFDYYLSGYSVQNAANEAARALNDAGEINTGVAY